MQSSNTPNKIPLPFASDSSALRNVIPENSADAPNPNNASYQLGFPPITMLPIESGGLPFYGQDMNGILNALSSAARWANAGGLYKYDATFANDTNVAGYPKGAVLIKAGLGGFWFNTTENNTSNPDTGGAGWVDLSSILTNIPTQTSIAGLRTRPKTGPAFCFVSGYYASGDGGGGVYYYDSADVTSSDNGGTIIVAADGGRWKLIYTGILSVKQFGAKGDSSTDDTSSIQAALNAAGIGSQVYMPCGRYKITSTLRLLQSQKLVGESGLAAFKANLYQQLSTIDVYVGQGSTTTPAVLLDLGSGVHGVCFNHPNQAAPTATTPVQFGWTIATDTSKPYALDDVTIRDVMFVNAYRGISLDNSGRWNVENVYGDCISEGIFADRGYDVCRMRNVHIWTFTYTPGTNLMSWIATNGRAFNFNRIDMLVSEGCFQYGRNIGYDFNDAGNGAVWADFFGCMSDVANIPVRINKAARIRWFGGSLVPYIASEPCVITSSDISTAGQGPGQVVFTATQFHDLARCGAVITSSTGNFSFTDCDFERAEVSVISESTANVSVENPKTRFGTNSRLTVLGDGANTRFNGVPNPTLSTDVSPANFGMGSWTSGVPNNWTFISGSSANIQNIGSGYARLLLNSASSSVISYQLPASIRDRKGLHTVRVLIRYFGVSDATLTFWTRRYGGGNQQSVRSFTNFNHGQAIWYDIPIVAGYDTGILSFDIEWSSPTYPAGAYIEIAGLSIYEADDSTIKQDVIDSLMRREFLDPFGYGPPIGKSGSNRVIQQAINPPTAGTWKVNDKIIRYPLAVGQPKGWVCTVAGTPGTWVSEGNL